MHTVEKAEILKNLIIKTGLSIREFSNRAGIPYTTLRSILERGVGKASVDNVLKICRALNITTEELDDIANGKDRSNDKPDSHWTPSLSEKDHYDIAIQLESILDGMNSQAGLMFDGDEMDETTQELMRQSIGHALEITRLSAKEKFTPKKYRK